MFDKACVEVIIEDIYQIKDSMDDPKKKRNSLEKDVNRILKSTIKQLRNI